MTDDRRWGKEELYGDHGIVHLRTVTPAVQPEEIGDLLVVPGPYQRIFWAKLGPGGFIIPHRDAGPWWDRWHIPVEPAGWFWEDGERLEPDWMVPFRVRHWLPHAVWNDTDRERVHLIVDRAERPADAPVDGPLEFTPMIPEVQAMIDNLRTNDLT